MANHKPEPPGLLSEAGDHPETAGGVTSRLFFVARYNDHAMAIRKSKEYSATIASIQKAFLQLRSVDGSRIHLSSQMPGLGEEMIGINDELWEDLVSYLLNVQVNVSPTSDPQDNQGSTEHSSWSTAATKSKQINVYVKDTRGYLNKLRLPLFTSSTVRELKNLVMLHVARLPQHFSLGCEGHANLADDKQLHHYNIKNDSTVTLVTEFQIYLVMPDTQRHAVTVSSFVTVRTIKNLARDAFQIHPDELVVSYNGGVLSSDAQIGSTSQLIPDCEISVNKFAGGNPPANQLCTVTVLTNNSLQNHTFSVLLDSPLSDIKELILNKLKIPLFAQELTTDGGAALTNIPWTSNPGQYSCRIKLNVHAATR